MQFAYDKKIISLIDVYTLPLITCMPSIVDMLIFLLLASMLLAIPLFTINGMAITFSLAITNSMLTSTVYAQEHILSYEMG
jgi:hypothetical protein